MDSSPGEFVHGMPEALSVASKALKFKVDSVCRSIQGPLPQFVRLLDGPPISMESFALKYGDEKWNPILIAENINLEEFENLVENHPTYGRKFCYDWNFETKRYFIVDSPSYEHGYYSGEIVHRLFEALDANFHNVFYVISLNCNLSRTMSQRFMILAFHTFAIDSL